MVKRILMILLWIVLLGGGFVFYWIQDANRIKPELEQLIEEQAGIPVTIGGDLSWRLFPPLTLQAEQIAASYEGQDWTAERLSLDIDVMTVLRTRDVNRWRVQSLTLTNTVGRDARTEIDIKSLTLREFELGKPSPLEISMVYTGEGAEPLPVEMTGLVTVQSGPDRYEITNADLSTPYADGVCNLEASPASSSAPLPPATLEDLIPVATWRAFDWSGRCDLSRLALDDLTFDSATVDLANTAANSATRITIPEFFGGMAILELQIDASGTPVRWILTPDLTGVDSQRLMAWLDQRLEWMAPLAYNGTLKFEGNTADALIASLSGETRFDGGRGAISIIKIKQPLLAVATMLQEPGRVSGWPDLWQYDRLEGVWRADRQHHTLDFALDNLSVIADGNYDPAADRLDMMAELTFRTLTEGKMFELNPVLMDLPIPVRCRGSLENPECRVDQKAAQRIVASVLTSKEGNEAREKLEEKIDEEVPEEYRDAARGLLDLLGRSLQDKNQ
jgi:hypothetical protein